MKEASHQEMVTFAAAQKSHAETLSWILRVKIHAGCSLIGTYGNIGAVVCPVRLEPVNS